MEGDKGNSGVSEVAGQFVGPPAPNEPQPGPSNSGQGVNSGFQQQPCTPQSILDLTVAGTTARPQQSFQQSREVASTSEQQATELNAIERHDRITLQLLMQQRAEFTKKLKAVQLQLNESEEENRRVKAELENVKKQMAEVNEYAKQKRNLEAEVKRILMERSGTITESVPGRSQMVAQTVDRERSAAPLAGLKEWLYFEFTSTKEDIRKQNLEMSKLVERLGNTNKKLEELKKLNWGKKESAVGGQNANEGARTSPDDGQVAGPSSVCRMGNLALGPAEGGHPVNDDVAGTSHPPATTGVNGPNNSDSAGAAAFSLIMVKTESGSPAVVQGGGFDESSQRIQKKRKIKKEPVSGGGLADSAERPESNGESGEPEEPSHVQTRAETRWQRIQAARADNNASNNRPVAAKKTKSTQKGRQQGGKKVKTTTKPNSTQRGGQQGGGKKGKKTMKKPNSSQGGGRQQVGAEKTTSGRRSARILKRVKLGRVAKARRGN